MTETRTIKFRCWCGGDITFDPGQWPMCVECQQVCNECTCPPVLAQADSGGFLAEAVVQSVGAEHDPVNHPKHYLSHPSGVECLEITRHMNFNIGNVIKYIWRCDDKGAEIEDLEKAAFYLNDEIQRRKGMLRG